MNQKLTNEQEWEKPNNWKWGGFYNSSIDSRTWVPKKPREGGWTLNFGKKRSYIYLIAIVTLPIMIAILFRFFIK